MDKENTNKPTLYGWVYPRCGKVHSPYSTECNCAPPIKILTIPTTSTSIAEDFYYALYSL